MAEQGAWTTAPATPAVRLPISPLTVRACHQHRPRALLDHAKWLPGASPLELPLRHFEDLWICRAYDVFLARRRSVRPGSIADCPTMAGRSSRANPRGAHARRLLQRLPGDDRGNPGTFPMKQDQGELDKQCSPTSANAFLYPSSPDDRPRTRIIRSLTLRSEPPLSVVRSRPSLLRDAASSTSGLPDRNTSSPASITYKIARTRPTLPRGTPGRALATICLKIAGRASIPLAGLSFNTTSRSTPDRKPPAAFHDATPSEGRPSLRLSAPCAGRVRLMRLSHDVRAGRRRGGARRACERAARFRAGPGSMLYVPAPCPAAGSLKPSRQQSFVPGSQLTCAWSSPRRFARRESRAQPQLGAQPSVLLFGRWHASPVVWKLESCDPLIARLGGGEYPLVAGSLLRTS